MSVSNKKNKADDSEILETFLGVFFRDTRVFRGNWKFREQDCFYLFLFVLFLNCTCSDLEYAFSEHIQNKWIHRTETIKQ